MIVELRERLMRHVTFWHLDLNLDATSHQKCDLEQALYWLEATFLVDLALFTFSLKDLNIRRQKTHF